MQHYASAITGRLPLVLLLVTLSGCDWVDSTGVQGATVTASLRNGEAVSISENVALTAPLMGTGSGLANWEWTLEETDVRNQCTGFSGFDEYLSTTSLNEACSDHSNCTFAIDETSSEIEATSFTLQMPSLRAPVALSYQLQNHREDGTLIERQQLICGLSINEAPSAKADNYLAIPGEVLIVNADSSNSLLANDSDDDDIRNVALLISSVSVPPAYAAQFSFDPNGGFLYEPLDNIPLNADGVAEDQFVYRLTDGIHQVSGTVLIRIADNNEAPQQLQSVPNISLTATTDPETSSADALLMDLSAYFTDPDGDSLSYAVPSDQLPASGSIIVSADGQLRAQPTLLDIGRYRLEVSVSDGLASITDVFTITVSEPETREDNTAPVAQDISNRIVSDQFDYDVSRFFSDSDGDTLTFSAEGLPEGVVINDTGTITGEASSANRGRWLIRVHVNDGNGGTTSDAFQLNIK